MEGFTQLSPAIWLHEPVLFPLAQSPLLKLAAFPLIHLVLCHVFIADRVFGFENVVARARRRLNDTEYIDYAVPRPYIYSSGDGMVPAQDVEDHAAQARHAGYSKVVSLHCGASRHCAHASKYPERDWNAIGKLLDQSNDMTREQTMRVPASLGSFGSSDACP